MGKDLNGKELGQGLSQRKDGIYQARYANEYGKRVCIYNKDLRVLRQELAKKTADDLRGLSTKNPGITLSEWHTKWRKAYKEGFVKDNTLLNYDRIFRLHIEPILGKERISKITKTQCSLLLKKIRDKGVGYSILLQVKLVMIDMFDRAIEDELLNKNPMRGVHIPVLPPDNEPRVLTKDEQKLFFECAAGTFYYNLFVVAINTGLRPGELLALTKNDIDFESGFINIDKTLNMNKLEGEEIQSFKIGTPKNKYSVRRVPMTDACRNALIRQLKQKIVVQNNHSARETKYPECLFTTQFNTPLSVKIYKQAIDKIVKEINMMLPPIEKIQNFSGHTFRHTFATRCIESGIQPKTLQKYLGHASINMTMDLYVHVTDDTLKNELVNKFEDITPLMNY